jgi:hypothetical protein
MKLLLILILCSCVILLNACGGSDKKKPPRMDTSPETVNMSSYTRKAFSQLQDDNPLSIDTVVITQDVSEEIEFADLLL